MILQGDFFSSFLRGALGSSQLLNAFIRREQFQQMMKETKEREKQTKMEIDQGLAEILQGDQTGGQVTGVGTTPVYGVPGLPSIPSLEVSPQGGPQTPAGKNVATQAAISAADATAQKVDSVSYGVNSWMSHASWGSLARTLLTGPSL
jgi:hypothetical protein